MTERALSAVLEAACDLMTDLNVYPLAFEAGADGAYVLAVMNSRMLRTRSRGPYSRDDLPPEALAMAEWVQLRLMNREEPPELTVEGGGVWPRLVVMMPYSGVVIRFVVPEEAPPVIPTIEVDRSRCDRLQREVHDDALRATAYSDQSVRPSGDTGFTTRIGSARVEDSGGATA